MGEFLPFESDELVAAAALGLERRGLRNLTLKDIAELAGCSVTEVQHRFRNPVEAAAAIMQSIVSGMEQALEDDTDEQSLLSERLMALLLYEMHRLDRYRGVVEEVMFTAVDPSSGLALHVASAQVAPIGRYLELVERVIADCRHRGQISKWASPRLAASAFWTLHLAIMMAWLNANEEQFPQLLGKVNKWVLTYCRRLGERRLQAPEQDSASSLAWP